MGRGRGDRTERLWVFLESITEKNTKRKPSSCKHSLQNVFTGTDDYVCSQVILPSLNARDIDVGEMTRLPLLSGTLHRHTTHT